MDQALLSRVAKAYGLEITQSLAPQKGYRNKIYPILVKNTWLNLTLHKEEPGIVARLNRANLVSGYLADQDYPSRQLADNRIMQLTYDQHQRYIGLYTYLPGKTIPWEAYTMAHLKNLGKSMAKMHNILRLNKISDLPSVYTESLDLLQEMRAYFSRPGVSGAMTAKLSIKLNPRIFEKVLLGNLSTDEQALHMDFVRGNILFDDQANITGVIDFEKVAYGSVVFDVARTLAFLLVDCKFKSNEKVIKYFLNSGYIKYGGGQVSNPQQLAQLVNFFLIHDFYKFLLHKPYESLQQNEHFVRTAALLKHKRLVKAI